MNNIIKKNIHKENWSDISDLIINNKIDWDDLIDQTNYMIHYLAYHNKTDLIKLIDPVILPKLLTQSNLEGDTVCHIAAKLNNIDLLSLSINFNPESLYARNKLHCTPLFYLVDNHNLIKQIARNVTINDHYLNDEYTFLEYYIINASSNISMIKFLLNTIKTNSLTNNCLFAIVKSETINDDNKIQLLKLFIKSKIININSLDYRFFSPLIVSIYQNNDIITKFLLEAGTDPNYFGPEYTDNPLTIAITNNNPIIIKLLLDYDINIGQVDKYLRTPLHYLFANINDIPLQLKQRLLNKISSVNICDGNLDSILNLIIHNDNWQNYQDILVKKKLNIYLGNRLKVKPIDGVLDEDLDKFLMMVYQSYLNQLDSDMDWKDDLDLSVSKIILKDGVTKSYKDAIMKKIINGQSYPLTNKSSSFYTLKMFNPPKTNMTHFSSYTYNYICFLCYILNKYPTIKIPSRGNNQMENKSLKKFYQEMIVDYKEKSPDNNIFRSIIKDYVSHSSMLINHVIIWRDINKYFFSPYIVEGIYETIKKYPSTDFILLKLSIITNKQFNHANILIYDVKNKYVERFDPYGKVPFIDNKGIDNVLESFFKDYFPKIQYISSSDITNRASFQILADEGSNSNYVENDPTGFCVAWCVWYLEMRINNNNNIDPKTLIKKSIYQINKSEDKFKDYIRNYSNYLDNEKNNILGQGGLEQKYWYTRHIPTPIYKAYLKYIRKLFDSYN